MGHSPCLQKYVLPSERRVEGSSSELDNAMLRLDQLLQEVHSLIAGLAVLNPLTLRMWLAASVALVVQAQQVQRMWQQKRLRGNGRTWWPMDPD